MAKLVKVADLVSNLSIVSNTSMRVSKKPSHPQKAKAVAEMRTIFLMFLFMMLAFYRLKTDLYTDISRLERRVTIVSGLRIHLALFQQVAECEKIEGVYIETAL